MRLDELVRRVGGLCELPAPRGPEVRDVHLDSRRVAVGDLFAALPGGRDDGLRHAADAVVRGAVVVLTPQGRDLRAAVGLLPGLEVAHWTHAAPRRALARAAALVHGEPTRSMAVAGITGTNGKTTTAHVLGHLLACAGRTPAVLGTAGHRIAGAGDVTARHTTPDAPELFRLLARHARAGGDAAVMEVSSHALVQERTAGVDFDVAVFTNLTRDHLDYHGDMHRYALAKARLFEGLRPGATAVINADDAAWRTMSAAAERAGARVVTYSTRHAADLRACRLRVDSAGSRFELDGMGISSAGLRLPLRGRYNVENALAAVAAARSLGAGPSAIVEGLAATPAPPGRLEPVPTGARGFDLFVDYAHAPDALGRVLRTCREELTARPVTTGHGGRLIVVFGCGGERDAGKRRAMGRVAAGLADVVVVTSDNPRSEDPARIADEIRAGMGGPPVQCPTECHVELDRRSAIELAVDRARPGDIVLVAGKGHETTQEVDGRVRPFDDRRVAQEVLA